MFVAGLDAGDRELYDAVSRMREASRDKHETWLGI